MNPEDNNLNPNPGVPEAGMNSEPLGTGGLTMADGLASAQDNLTSAGLAASTGEGVMDLNQIGATAPEAVMTPPIDEPLIPAAPVPGSIGSVTSVPPVSADPMVGEIPAEAPAAGTVPVAEPAPAPYNPFAQPASTAAPAPEPVSTGMAPDPAFQPAVPPKAKMQMNPLMIALCVVSGILLVATIVLTVLLIRAINNPKIVYVPQAVSEESNARIEMLTCSREADFAGYAGLEEPAMGSETMVASYTNNELRAMSMEYAMRFADESMAVTARDTFATEQAEVLAAISDSFAVNYDLDGGNLDIEIISGRDAFAETDAATLMYGLGGSTSSVSLNAVRGLYESAGFICSVE